MLSHSYVVCTARAHLLYLRFYFSTILTQILFVPLFQLKGWNSKRWYPKNSEHSISALRFWNRLSNKWVRSALTVPSRNVYHLRKRYEEEQEMAKEEMRSCLKYYDAVINLAFESKKANSINLAKVLHLNT